MAKKDPTTEKEKLVQNAVDSKIAAVRELIFGENMQEYSQEFDDVYSKLKKQKEETADNLADTTAKLENRINELQASLERSIEDLTSDMNQKLEELDDAKADRRKLGQALEKIAQMLQQ
jgi:predicted transcriptional regulator